MTMSWYRKVGETFGCYEKSRPSSRTIFVNHEPPPEEEVIISEHYPDNRIISSRYTKWNFLPKNLFEQFRRIANFYFLCIGVIQLGIDTPVSPATSILPLIFVVTVTAVKQGYEDWLRHKSDREVNNRPTFVLRNGVLIEIKSMDIKVGDVVQVKVNHGFPCDLVMLSSSDPEGNCYVTTANLDGETNLKNFSCVPDTRKCHFDLFKSLNAYIECEQPITDLYKFHGRISLSTENGETKTFSLGPENVLLRGARLRNNEYVYGCAIYTGQDTKMAMNSKAKSTKFSRIERSMNVYLIVFLLILIIEAAIAVGLQYWYVAQPRIGKPWYVPEDKRTRKVLKAVEDFLSFVVLLNYVIPISLYVTVEMQKFFGSLFFGWDLGMYDPVTDQPAKCNTSDLNEELGQVEYLFTDKTGTLTENDMQFRQCSVNGLKYEEVGGMLCERLPLVDQSTPVATLTSDGEEFFTVLALCHTVRVDHPEAQQMGASSMYSTTGYDYEYQASSPDEKAFVEACRRYGVIFHGMKSDHLEVSIKGKIKRYRCLHVLEFDPMRKRMSVITQDEDGSKYLLCKGAETAVLDRVKSGDKLSALQHVNEYAMLGLRTLVISRKKLSEELFNDIDDKLNEARKSLQNREEKLADVFEYVEKDLHVLGVTAVEDKLQDAVPKTIESLRSAGIKVWVLTGDKEETAVNVSYSAGHFKQGMTELRLTRITDNMHCAEMIRKHTLQIQQTSFGNRRKEFALIIDGITLTVALAEHSEMLRELCKICVAVLCCRMSPLQKAEVVKLIKISKEAPVTAAVGDGANDVSMIQEAHVGFELVTPLNELIPVKGHRLWFGREMKEIGIMGKEGRQAVRNSDYAFARFKFLSRALLLHGHYYYIRLSTLVQYFFYKNVAFITAQVYYLFFSAFSAQSVFESFYLMFYNITFTSLPILIYGLFEQHLKKSTLLENPHLYRNIRKNGRLSWKCFLQWNCLGVWHSLVCFFGTFLLFGNDVAMFSDGKTLGGFAFGSLLIMTCAFVANLKLCLETYYWCLPIFLSYLITAVGFFALIVIYNSVIWPTLIVIHEDLFFVFNTTFRSPGVWFCFFVMIVVALLPDILLRTAKDTFRIYNDEEKRTDVEIPEVQVLDISHDAAGNPANSVLLDRARFKDR